MTALLADLPTGDGPKRQHAKLRAGLSRIARRVATAALVSGREDILLEVYCAGISHAEALSNPVTKGEGS